MSIAGRIGTQTSESPSNSTARSGTVFNWETGGFAISTKMTEVTPPERLAWSGEANGILTIHVWTLAQSQEGTHVSTEQSWEGHGIATRVVTQLKVCNFQAPELSSFRPALTATSASRYKKLNCPRRSPVNARFAPDAVSRERLITAGRRAASNDMIPITPKNMVAPAVFLREELNGGNRNGRTFKNCPCFHNRNPYPVVSGHVWGGPLRRSNQLQLVPPSWLEHLLAGTG